jgi:hypothetical protein
VPRALAGATAAALAAWLAAHVLAPGAVSPLLAALAGGVAVAALPRIGWVVLLACAGGALAAQGRPGGALLALGAGLIPVVLLPRRPASWPLAAVAPALGAIGLAGAWPALAARATTAWRRAALGATGWIALVAAEALAHTTLYLRLPHSIPVPSVWMPSLSAMTDHVLGPLVSSGAFAPALVWALAAVVLPWLVVVRPLPVTIVLVTIWTAVTASATTTVLHAAHSGALVPADLAILGAVAAAVVALGPGLAGTIRTARRSGNTPGGLA